MPDEPTFDQLLRRLRTGDADTIRLFVTQYEPFIRRAIRRRMNRVRFQPVVDSGDVCQSVLGSFLIRVAGGEYELDAAEQLEALLRTMIRNKVAALARRESAERRNRDRLQQWESGQDISADSVDDPARQAGYLDLLHRVRLLLSAEEAQMLQLRQEGYTWDEIATQLNNNALVLRKRLARALQSAAVELGLEHADE